MGICCAPKEVDRKQKHNHPPPSTNRNTPENKNDKTEVIKDDKNNNYPKVTKDNNNFSKISNKGFNSSNNNKNEEINSELKKNEEINSDLKKNDKVTKFKNENPTELKKEKLNNFDKKDKNTEDNEINIKIKKSTNNTEDKIENKYLNLNPQNYNNSQIRKDFKDTTFNSSYSINLKVTITRISQLNSFTISLYQYRDNTKENKKLINTSEIQVVIPNQKVLFNEDFIVDYDFTKIQPLEFIIKRKNKDDILSINLGEIIGKPRQIYLQNFDEFDFQIEAIMNSEIKKEMIFLIGLFGNIKGKKLYYTITNIGNRYDNNKNELVYKSDIMEKDSDLFFKQKELPLEKLSEDDNLEDNLIQISFYSKNNADNSNEELGNEKFSINQILQIKEIEINLKNDIKAKVQCRRKNFFNFLQFIYNDFHLVTTFCIDFSKNNIVHNQKSKFKELLTTFMNVLAPYGDKFFNFYAYGFKLLKTSTEYINDIFPLSRKTTSIEINEVIPKYEKFLTKIEKTNNITNLNLIIKSLNENIKRNYDLQDKEYNIFLIFACHDIEDEEDFINELQITSSLNISIIIFGIGTGSFNKLQNILNKIKATLLKRDCVKYLKIDDNINEKVKYSLNNIPDSMIDFFCENNVIPKN